MNYIKYTDKELKELVKSLVFIVDTREQVNSHVLEKLTNHKKEKLDTGDYSVMIPANIEMGIMRDTYIKCLVERKNSIDELASSIKEERFENELIRSQDSRLVLVVEDSFDNLIKGNYRSGYSSNALLARLKSFEARYGFTTVFIPKENIGDYIESHLTYYARAHLKGYLKGV